MSWKKGTILKCVGGKQYPKSLTIGALYVVMSNKNSMMGVEVADNSGIWIRYPIYYFVVIIEA